MQPKEFTSASQMVKYFYDERFYNKLLIRQGRCHIHFSRRKAVVICAPKDKPAQCVDNHSSIQAPTLNATRFRYIALSDWTVLV